LQLKPTIAATFPAACSSKADGGETQARGGKGVAASKAAEATSSQAKDWHATTKMVKGVSFLLILTFVKLRHMDRNRKHFLCKSRDGQSLCTFPFLRALPTATRYPPHSIHVLRCFFTMPSGLITLLTLSSDPIALGGCFCVVIPVYVPKALYESDCALDGRE